MIAILLKVFTSNFLVTLLKLVTGFVFPRMMSVESYAEYQTYALYITYICALHLGFSDGMGINYAGKPYERTEPGQYKAEVRILLAISLCFTAIFALATLLCRSRMLLYVTLSVLPFCMVQAYQLLYQAWGEFGRFTRMNMVTAAVPILGTLALTIITGRMEAAQYIGLYILIYSIYTVILLVRARRYTRGAPCARLRSEQNAKTWKVGAAVCLAGYVNVLFHSVDKQFIKLLFDTQSFAVYSFGLSLQNIMMVFFTSIAQALFNFLASGKLREEDQGTLMRGLLIFGALSGAALQACRIAVMLIVPKYAASLEITGVYFLVFPALAVINCLYINLYKLTRQTGRYVRTLSVVLVLSVLLNAGFSALWHRPVAVTAATVVVYYLWLVISARHFDKLRLTVRDGGFLALFFAVYLLCGRIANPFAAMSAYLLLILGGAYAIYPQTVRYYGGVLLAQARSRRAK